MRTRRLGFGALLVSSLHLASWKHARGGEVSAGPCGFSPEELRAWLVEDGERLAPAAARLLHQQADLWARYGVDGALLCSAPAAWLRHQWQSPPGRGRGGSGYEDGLHGRRQQQGAAVVPSALRPCAPASLDRVRQALDQWRVGDPAAAVRSLAEAHSLDAQCCAPFRELSRAFLGPNSPFVNLRTAALRQAAHGALESALRATGSDGQWSEVVSFAHAHALHHLGRREEASAVLRSLIRPLREEPPGPFPSVGTPPKEALLVATVASEVRPELVALERSARLANVSLKVLGLGEAYSGHETKLRWYHELLHSRNVTDDSIMVLIDAYDILLFPSFREIASRFLSHFHHPIVFSAERSLWPDQALAALYPQSGDGLAFLNSGAIIGRAWALRYMLDQVLAAGAVALCGPDDQRSFHRFFLEHPNLATLDVDGILFQTLHFLTQPVTVHADGQLRLPPAALSSPRSKSSTGDQVEHPKLYANLQATPCLAHGNGGDGKYAFRRLLDGWERALRQAQSVEVQPPPFAVGISLYGAGDLVGAEKAFTEATESKLEEDQILDSLYNLGVVRQEQGQLLPALDAYRRALALDPGHRRSQLNSAVVLYSLGRTTEASSIVDGVLKSDPENEHARQLQVAFIQQKKGLRVTGSME